MYNWVEMRYVRVGIGLGIVGTVERGGGLEVVGRVRLGIFEGVLVCWSWIMFIFYFLFFSGKKRGDDGFSSESLDFV